MKDKTRRLVIASAVLVMAIIAIGALFFALSEAIPKDGWDFKGLTPGGKIAGLILGIIGALAIVIAFFVKCTLTSSAGKKQKSLNLAYKIIIIAGIGLLGLATFLFFGLPLVENEIAKHLVNSHTRLTFAYIQLGLFVAGLIMLIISVIKNNAFTSLLAGICIAIYAIMGLVACADLFSAGIVNKKIETDIGILIFYNDGEKAFQFVYGFILMVALLIAGDRVAASGGKKEGKQLVNQLSLIGSCLIYPMIVYFVSAYAITNNTSKYILYLLFVLPAMLFIVTALILSIMNRSNKSTSFIFPLVACLSGLITVTTVFIKYMIDNKKYFELPDFFRISPTETIIKFVICGVFLLVGAVLSLTIFKKANTDK